MIYAKARKNVKFKFNCQDKQRKPNNRFPTVTFSFYILQKNDRYKCGIRTYQWQNFIYTVCLKKERKELLVLFFRQNTLYISLDF